MKTLIKAILLTAAIALVYVGLMERFNNFPPQKNNTLPILNSSHQLNKEKDFIFLEHVDLFQSLNKNENSNESLLIQFSSGSDVLKFLKNKSLKKVHLQDDCLLIQLEDNH